MARALWSPEEYAGGNEAVADSESWVRTGSVMFAYLTTAFGFTPRKDLNNDGGSYIMVGSGSQLDSILRSPALETELNHFHFQVAFGVATTGADMRVTFLDSALATSVRVDLVNPTTGFLTFGDNTTTRVTSSYTGVLNSWQYMQIECYIHATSGFFKVWIENTLIIDYSGAVVGNPVAHVQLQSENDTVYDDLLLNSITLRYDGGGGTFAPSPGDTITDGTTGATAVITAINGDGTSGVLTLEGWNETAFGNNNTITESGGATTALVDAPSTGFSSGFEPNSKKMRNEYVKLVRANGAGAFGQLTPSTGSNFENINAIPVTTATYNQANAADEQDTYVHDASGLDANAVVRCVASTGYARSSLTGIDGLQLLLRDSTTVYATPRFALGSAYTNYLHTWNTRPVDDLEWDRTGIVTGFPQYGVKFVS